MPPVVDTPTHVNSPVLSNELVKDEALYDLKPFLNVVTLSKVSGPLTSTYVELTNIPVADPYCIPTPVVPIAN